MSLYPLPVGLECNLTLNLYIYIHLIRPSHYNYFFCSQRDLLENQDLLLGFIRALV